MSRGRGLALLNKLKERQQEEIGRKEKEAFLNALKERKKASNLGAQAKKN